VAAKGRDALQKLDKVGPNLQQGFMDRRKFMTRGVASVGATTLCANGGANASDPLESGGCNYPLPSFTKGSRLLFQGDSITDMKWGRNESDRNHYLGHSYVYLIAARLGVDMPEASLDFYNRGISGHAVADLRKRWQKDAIDMKPDLLSILIGTNDVGNGVRADAFESDYRHLLDASRKANPDLRLVLLDPFVLRSGRLKQEKAWTSRRSATDELGQVVARLAKDHDAVHVRTQEIFDAAAEAAPPEHWIWDGVHPLPQGHELIARHWIKQVSARWPKA
jgi:lysophospholipase L1-like esterase